MVIPSVKEFEAQVKQCFESVNPKDNDLESLYATRYHQACVEKNAVIRLELEGPVDALKRLV